MVQGIVVAGEAFKGIKLFRLNGFHEQLTKWVPGAVVFISDGVNSVQLRERGDSVYHFANDSLVFMPETDYYLTVEVDGVMLSARTRTPSALTWLSALTDTISVDPNSLGQPVFNLSWSELADYRYVLGLAVLADNPVKIPFLVESGWFNQNYKNPLLNSYTSIFDIDFEFYGEHQINLYCIDEAYESVFFFLPEVQGVEVQDAPDNIKGGQGYFCGASQIEYKFIIN